MGGRHCFDPVEFSNWDVWDYSVEPWAVEFENEGGWWSAMCYLMAEEVDMLEKFFGGTWGMRCEGDVTCLSELDCADFNTDAA